MSKKAIVIGSGVGGMAAAIRLAVQGFSVSVYERNAEPGGKLGWFEKDGFSFDKGPSLFTQPENIVELFELANEPLSAYFSYEQVPISCHYFFENGKQFALPANKEALAQTLQDELGEDPKDVVDYLYASEKLYNSIGHFFINHSLHKRKTYFDKGILKALLASRYGQLFRSLHQHNALKLKSLEAVQLFDRYATYNGSNPYKAPAMLSLIPHLEMNQGTFYPKGGMISITNALYKLAIKKGVTFCFNTHVERIIEMDGHAKGIVINGENIFADVIVSNADAFFTYQKLLRNTPKARNILKQERSSSALIFYWGINKVFKELGLHNIFFSSDYKAEFNCLFNKKELHPDPTVYINITSKMESGHAPSGKENWFVMVNAPANTGQNWEAIKAKAKEGIIIKLSRLLKTDIGSLIESETILDPISIEQNTGSYMGSLYGTSSNSKLAAFFRHPNFSQTIKGLYFVGGSVHPGGGIPLCLKSAAIAAALIANDFKKGH